MKVRPVNVDMDIEGNYNVEPVEIKKEESEKEEESNEEIEETESTESEEDTAEGETQNTEGEESEEAEESTDENVDEESDEADDFVAEDEEDEEGEDEVVTEQQSELPDSVQKLLKFIENEGGTVEEFVALQKDWSKENQDTVILEYLKKENPELSVDDLIFELNEEFGVDEDEDTDAAIRRKQIGKKKLYGKALKELTEKQKNYSFESREKEIPKEYQEALKFKQQLEQRDNQSSQASKASRNAFLKETEQIFSKDFKGFEVKIGDSTVLYKPENVDKLRKDNLNVNNFLSKFIDDKGVVKDAVGYHKALAVASNPEAFAQFFIEKGKADLMKELDKTGRNVDTKIRQTMGNPTNPNKPKFKAVEGTPKSNTIIKLRSY